jgi:hypothetical protein
VFLFLWRIFALRSQKRKEKKKKKKTPVRIVQGLVLGKKLQKSPHFEEKKVTSRHYLNNQFSLVARTLEESSLNLLYCLTCSQIWLIPLVDDRQSGYFTKLRKRKNHGRSVGW